MTYDLDIKPSNQQPHADIEKDIQAQQNGLFTFILRINNGTVVDYSVVEYADARKYLIIKEIIVQEFTLAHHPDE